MATTVWHNPRCSKSRQTVALLNEHNIQYQEYRYLDESPSIADIQNVLAQLGLTAAQLLRANEEAAKAQNLKQADNNTIIAAMAANPKLIERPIVVHNGGAKLGRPPENVLSLFG